MVNEYFHPIFRNREYRTGPMNWRTLYGILYLGMGTVGFGFDQISRTSNFVVDTGIGFEASVTVRDFDVLLGVIWATTLRAPRCEVDDSSLECRDLEGSKIRYSVRTVR